MIFFRRHRTHSVWMESKPPFLCSDSLVSLWHCLVVTSVNFGLVDRWPKRSLSTITVESAPPSTETSTLFWWWKTPGSSDSNPTTWSPNYAKETFWWIIHMCGVLLCFYKWESFQHISISLLSVLLDIDMSVFKSKQVTGTVRCDHMVYLV